MTTQLLAKLETAAVLPLIEADDAQQGIAIAQALHAAGIPVVEVVQPIVHSAPSAAAVNPTAIHGHQTDDAAPVSIS